MPARSIESGPVREVLARPRHPYTMGLRNAFPDLMSDALELVPIGGSPPDLSRAAAGLPLRAALPVRPGRPARIDPAMIAGNERDHHGRPACRDGEADTLRTAALDPATWQRSSSFATS